MKRITSGIMLLMLCLGVAILAFDVKPIKSESEIHQHCLCAESTIRTRTLLHEEFDWENEWYNCLGPLGKLGLIEREDFRRIIRCDGDFIELVVGVDVPKQQIPLLENMLSNYGGHMTSTISLGENVYAVTVKVPINSVYTFAEKVQANGLARYVEPNFKVNAFYEPNDPYWPVQWGPKKIDADIAWDTSIGSSDITVAIIDTGIDYTHLDLAANYVSLGYDWINNDTNPMDDNGHGTHCAGIVAAQLNNSIGIAGLAQVHIMTEKVLGADGWGTDFSVAQGIIHATDQGAKIISMSLGGDVDSDMLHDAVKYAYNHSVLIVAAAGNKGAPIKSYPGAYDEVVAVSATDSLDNLAYFSSYGDWIELSAPGVDIYSTVPGNSYTNKSGTSMACPHVTGVAALCWSVYPIFTRDQIIQYLERTADDLGSPGFDIYYGYGRVNARKAVTDVPEHDIGVVGLEHTDRLDPEQLNIFNVTISNWGKNNETNINVQFFVNESLTDSATIDFLEIGTSTVVNFSWESTVIGHYNITCYAVPMPEEDYTRNNVVSTFVLVRYPADIIVPDEYPTIQNAVNNATGGDSIYVRAGTYYEHVVVDKRVSLIGEEAETTVIDANWTGTPIQIVTDGVTVCSFTLQHSNWIIGNYYSGIYLQRSSGNNVSGNIIVNNGGFGIWLDYSDYNVIINNTVVGNDNTGVWLLHSSYNLFRDNNLSGNAFNLKVSRDYIEDIDPSNTINGKPIYYLVNQTDIVINPETFPNIGYLALVNSINVTVENLQLEEGNGEGLLLFNTTSSTITNNTFANNELGINLDASYNNNITSNNMPGNGLQLRSSYENIISNNTITQTGEGIFINGAWSNILNNNNITLNWYGIFSGFGFWNVISGNNIVGNTFINIELYYSEENMVFNNTIANSKYGIEQTKGGNNTIYGNNIMNNAYYGLLIEVPYYSSKIFHNNFINNMDPVFTYSNETWDNGYPSGGNYWSDNPSVDLNGGRYQNLTGSDGLGDYPYIINEYSEDHYPLMEPYTFSPHNVGITNIKIYKTILSQGCVVSINVTIFNYGDATEVFNVSLYANLNKIDTFNSIALAGKDSITIIFVWNTSDFARGRYLIKVVADPVQSETHILDNTYIDYVFVTIAGDVTSISGLPDGWVDMRDIGALCTKFMAKPSSPNWDLNYDLNDDDVINMRDIGIACSNFMKT